MSWSMIGALAVLLVMTALVGMFVYGLREAAATAKHKRQMEADAARRRDNALQEAERRAEHRAQREHEQKQWDQEAQ